MLGSEEYVVGRVRGIGYWYVTGGALWDSGEVEGKVVIELGWHENGEVTVKAHVAGEPLYICIGCSPGKAAEAVRKFIENLTPGNSVGTGPVTRGFDFEIKKVEINTAMVARVISRLYEAALSEARPRRVVEADVA